MSLSAWCIYVDCSAPENLAIAIERGVWGAKRLQRLEKVQSGDKVLFVSCMQAKTSPSPRGALRIKLSPFLETEVVARQVVLGEVTSEVYSDDSPLWADSLYPWRFNFIVLGGLENVEITALYPEILAKDEIDVIRKAMYDTDKSSVRALPLPMRFYRMLVKELAYPDEVPDVPELWEGIKKSVVVNRIERNRNAREMCISHHGTRCAVCGFDFGEVYGDIGKGYIHVHHVVPLSNINSEYRVDPLADLVPVCPNCHAMLHRKEPPYTVDELRHILHQNANG